MSRAAPHAVLTASQAELMAHIVDAVADKYGVTAADIRGRRQNACHAWARQVTLALCVEFTGETNAIVGGFFSLDPTTVLHAVRKVARIERETPAAASKLAEARQGIEILVPGITQRRAERAVDGHRRAMDETGAEHWPDAERQLDVLLRDLRHGLRTAIRVNPGALLAGLMRACSEINGKETDRERH